VPVRSKRYKTAAQMIPDGKTPRTLPDAVALLATTPKAKFDETVELHIKLDIDVKRVDQQIRGAISLPHGIGKQKKVIAFTDGEEAAAAKAAGAIEVGTDDLVKKIQDGWTDFDVAITSPPMMRFVGKLGKILGPTGKMPSPKNGTVTNDIPTAVKDFIAGKVEYRTDDGGNLHVPVGKRSFDATRLAENAKAFIDAVNAMRPSSVKGVFIKAAYIKSTMGPSIRIQS
jgi:large subunit ribosomal protein L1